MADQSAQHGQRLDDEMEQEVEGLVRGAPVDARAREDLDLEAIEQSTVPLGDLEEDEQHLEIIERSELARFLRPSALPADASTVLAVATEEHAPEAVLAELAALPAGVEFATVAEIWEALGHETEQRDHPLEAESAGTGTDELKIEVEVEEAETVTEPMAAGPSFEAPTVLAPEPAAEEPPTPAPPVAPAPEPGPTDPVRGALAFGLELVRASLGLADRALESIERHLLR
jgi:hypothetical protein